MLRTITMAVAGVAIGAGGSADARQASLQGIGVLPGYTRSSANGLSADGSTVVGSCNNGTIADFRAFRWTAAGGIQDLGLLPGGTFAQAHGVNGDGSVVVGRCIVGGITRAFRWTSAGGMQEVVAPPGSFTIAIGVSADGSVVAGTAGVGGVRAFRWTAAGGAVLLPLPGWPGMEAWAISDDGSTIVGESSGVVVPSQPFRWTAAGGTQPLGSLSPSFETHSVGVSGDAAVVVGTFGTLANSHGFKVIPPGAPQILPAPGAFTWSAHDASQDGSVIGGGLSPFPDSEAYLWSADPGNVVLSQHLASLGVNVADWTLSTIQGVSADGRTFAGRGAHTIAPGQTRDEAWIADLGPVCYPDCTEDGQLTIADFGCFQTRFVAADPYADCNGVGGLTIADFACFQTKFVAGCP